MSTGNKRVAIYTTFNSADYAYSLNRVVQDQIKMLVAHDYKPLVLVVDGFKPMDAYALPGVSLFYLPTATMSNEGQLPENWQEEVEKVYLKLKEGLKDIDVVITHDIISQPASMIYNLAGRKVTDEMPNLRWLHWIHSVFSSNMESNRLEASQKGREKWPHSYIVFPNSYDIPRVAKNFHVEEPDVKWCPHPTDIEEFFDMHEVSSRFIREKKILLADIIMVYPCRLDRGKQPHLLVELAGAIKRKGRSVKLIFMDFHSTGGDKVTYREEMKEQMKELNLTDEDVLFFSEFDPKFKYEAPHQVVKDLMCVSNVFMMPSRSETYSLVAQEAILTGNFVILNHDFFPFRSIFGDLPKYYQFSSNISISGYDGATDTTYGNIEAYFDDIANYIIYMTNFDKVLALKTKIRKERNIYAVFKEYFEPLLAVD
jgi:glycosyltransferase involved in cell wall biosynthesis